MLYTCPVYLNADANTNTNDIPYYTMQVPVVLKDAKKEIAEVYTTRLAPTFRREYVKSIIIFHRECFRIMYMYIMCSSDI